MANKKPEIMKQNLRRITESHTAYSVKLVKGQLVWVYIGETYDVLSPNEIAIQYNANKPFIGVDKSKIEKTELDPFTIFSKASAYSRSERRLRNLEQDYKDQSLIKMANAVSGLRKHLYITLMVNEFLWEAYEAEEEFDLTEKLLQEQGLTPHQINVNSKTVN